MVKKEILKGGGSRHSTERGWAEFHVLAPRVVLARYQGYAEEALFEPIVTESIAMGVLGVELLDKEVLTIGISQRHPPGDASVMSNEYHRDAWQAYASDIEISRD